MTFQVPEEEEGCIGCRGLGRISPLKMSGRSACGSTMSDDHSYGRLRGSDIANLHDTSAKNINICHVCNKDVKDGERALCCEGCKVWKHITCAKRSLNNYKVIKKQASLMWFCPDDCLKTAVFLVVQIVQAYWP